MKRTSKLIIVVTPLRNCGSAFDVTPFVAPFLVTIDTILLYQSLAKYESCLRKSCSNVAIKSLRSRENSSSLKKMYIYIYMKVRHVAYDMCVRPRVPGLLGVILRRYTKKKLRLTCKIARWSSPWERGASCNAEYWLWSGELCANVSSIGVSFSKNSDSFWFSRHDCGKQNETCKPRDADRLSLINIKLALSSTVFRAAFPAAPETVD